MNDREFVTFCYQRILGREPDVRGLHHYVVALSDRALTRQQLMLDFLESPEYRQRQGNPQPAAAAAPSAEFVPAGHYYSAIPSADDRQRALANSRAAPTELPGIDLGIERQWALLEDLRPLLESGGLTDEPAGGRRYGFTNPSFGPGDAIVLQALMRHFRPRRIVEVGSGHSSALMLDVDEFHLGRSVEFTFLEPYPDLLKSLMKPGDPSWAVRQQIVQEADLEPFRRLEANDILFIDSTHVLKAGSDVSRLLFEVLPVLAPGVLAVRVSLDLARRGAGLERGLRPAGVPAIQPLLLDAAVRQLPGASRPRLVRAARADAPAKRRRQPLAPPGRLTRTRFSRRPGRATSSRRDALRSGFDAHLSHPPLDRSPGLARARRRGRDHTLARACRRTPDARCRMACRG